MENQKQNYNSEYAAIFFVSDLERQIQFYRDSIGLELQWRDGSKAGLGGCKANVLLLTTEQTTGKNKLEITLPSRRELAKVVGRLCTIKYPNKSLDFGNKHATVLLDPEGNEITISVKTESSKLPVPQPLDIELLFNELDPDDRLCDKMSEQARLQQLKAD
jgi:catechol-2,3-dioxygenase